ncbi:alpha/beta hydrolase-fold protein [Streptomyces sp. RB6PN25]|uniref:Alpha/beta hydrolase-fold protein n=1 Tax=Streptomyces humicola TaxID=2953240 RepID=A0ABT1PWJ7_9ACTN|nr:alpha/beta hydrolase-fold protein [Streptomyces humicola]MCQ4082014.1 alpha/beta hydrolase-fold protein [Streptomyces humicola]
MGLTSKIFFIALAVIATAMIAGTLWLWPRAAGQGPAAWLGRLGMLAATQVSIMALLLVAANDTYGFYSSWNDLLGQAEGKQTLDEPGAPAGRPAALTVTGTFRDARLKGGRERAGLVEAVTFHGAASGLTTDGYVYLPPQYFQKGHEYDHFPVVVALTGYPGVAKNLITELDIPRTVSDDIRTKKIQPVIYVLARPAVVPGRDTNCTDIPGGSQALTFFNQDLPMAVAGHYRTTGAPGTWGAVGDSTGGYCALKFAMTNPVRYGAAAGLSADYFARRDGQTGDLYGGNAQVRRENDLTWRLEHMPPPPVSLLVSSSRKGEENYGPTLTFAAKARPPTRVTTLIRDEGGHNFQTWLSEYPEVVLWMDRQLTLAVHDRSQTG